MLVRTKLTSKISAKAVLTLAACSTMQATGVAYAKDLLTRVAALEQPAIIQPRAKPIFASVSGAAEGSRPDVSALRFYATRGEQDRVRAEIKRLKQLYPGWQQPENIFSDESPEEKKLWKLFSSGKLLELRSEIERLSHDVPSFDIPTELLQKLDQVAQIFRLHCRFEPFGHE